MQDFVQPDPDVILAHYEGAYWLVCGVEHIDALLVNELPAGCSVVLVDCDSKAEVYELWDKFDGIDGPMPWQIHPAIAERIRQQQLGQVH